MFLILLFNLRNQGVEVGIQEWITFLKGLHKELVTTLDELYGFGRAVFCSSEAQFDDYDLAFTASFDGVEIPKDISTQIGDWLDDALMAEGALVKPNIPMNELWDELYKRLQEQEERHDGGNYWVGTGGKSPFGNSGRASEGIRVGGGSKNRSAISVASERQWESYRSDKQLDIRDIQIVLKELRRLSPEGAFELDIDRSIRKTVDNGGEIELEFRREKINRIHLVLLMDSGGSMEAYARLVQQFFTAASEAKGFKSFEAWNFHNVPYGVLFREDEGYERASMSDLLRKWTSNHRIVWVGDACMAPYELMSATNYNGMSGLDWIKRVTGHCPHSVWLNPEPENYWRHPTIEAIGRQISMFPLTVDGLRRAVGQLRTGEKQRKGLEWAQH